MSKHYVSMTDFEYVADLLRALRVFAPEFEHLSEEVTEELIESLGVSEAALRRAAPKSRSNPQTRRSDTQGAHASCSATHLARASIFTVIKAR